MIFNFKNINSVKLACSCLMFREGRYLFHWDNWQENHHNHIQVHNSCNIDDQYMLHLKHQDSNAIARPKLPEYAKSSLKLKQEQCQAVDSLRQGSDCIAVLPQFLMSQMNWEPNFNFSVRVSGKSHQKTIPWCFERRCIGTCQEYSGCCARRIPYSRNVDRERFK